MEGEQDGQEPRDRQETKDRVLHMRVEPSLDTQLRARAERLGVSVSNLVRNILNHTLGLAEDVIRDSQEVARSARGEAGGDRPYARDGAGDAGPASPAARVSRVLGWQRFTLGLNALCERCNGILPRGTEAAIGVLDGPGKRPIICVVCADGLVGGGVDDA